MRKRTLTLCESNALSICRAHFLQDNHNECSIAMNDQLDFYFCRTVWYSIKLNRIHWDLKLLITTLMPTQSFSIGWLKFALELDFESVASFLLWSYTVPQDTESREKRGSKVTVNWFVNRFLDCHWILFLFNEFERWKSKNNFIWFTANLWKGLSSLAVRDWHQVFLGQCLSSSGNYECYIHPSPKVMADFFRHKNQHDAFIQFAQFSIDLWNVC